jgi:hypothetical protein
MGKKHDPYNVKQFGNELNNLDKATSRDVNNDFDIEQAQEQKEEYEAIEKKLIQT